MDFLWYIQSSPEGSSVNLETQLHQYQWWHQSFGTQEGKHQLITELGHISSVQGLIMSTVWAPRTCSVEMSGHLKRNIPNSVWIWLCVSYSEEMPALSQNSDVILSIGCWIEKPWFNILASQPCSPRAGGANPSSTSCYVDWSRWGTSRHPASWPLKPHWPASGLVSIQTHTT